MEPIRRRLYRSSDDRMFAGVLAGIADYFAIDPSLVRVSYALVAVLTGIIPLLLVYVLLAIAVPEEPPGFIASLPFAPSPGTPGDDAWRAAQAGERAMRREARRARRRQGPDDVALVLGAVLVVVGLVFLVRPYFQIDWDLVWPVVVIGMGVLVIVGGVTRPRPR